MLDSVGGWSGTLVAAIPPVVFVAVNAAAGLHWAIVAAVIAGVLLTIYRLIRRQPLQQALTGLFSVAVAAVIAARTGQARGYFLVGIAAAVAYGAVFAISIIARRPLVGVLWEFVDPTPLPEGRHWRAVRPLRRGYDLASLIVVLMFGSRALVQGQLFSENRTGWLAVARLAMGYPLYIIVIGAIFLVIRRARRLVALEYPELAERQADADDLAEQAIAVEPDEPGEPGEAGELGSGRADRLADGRFGLGQRDEQ